MRVDRTVVAVVMAGGSGTRLYPASRGDRPKQLLAVETDSDAAATEHADRATSGRSLLARTLDRAATADRRVVLTGPDHAERVREHVRRHVGVEPDVWVEPAPRDTGPALVYAAARARAAFEDPVLACLPSDHHVAGPFADLLARMTRVAVETDALVCVGVEPDRPATGYGYVRAGPETDGYAPVTAFTEKPDAERAGELLAEGALWNAGMFAWTPAALLEAARETPLAPLVAAADATAESTVADAYAAVEPRSVDHAVMERTDAAVVVPAREVEWDDLGTWDALGRVGPTDDADTVTLGETLTVDTTDSVVASDGDTHVTAVGVSDLVVAAYDDRVLVVPRGEADRVREAVTRLRESGAF